MIYSSNIKLTVKETFNAGKAKFVHPFKESNVDYYYGPYLVDSNIITYTDDTDTQQTIDLTNETSLRAVIGAKIYDNIINYLLVSDIAVDEVLLKNYFFAYCYLFVVNNLCEVGRTIGLIDMNGNCVEFHLTYNQEINDPSNKILYFTKKFNSYTDDFFKEFIANNLKMINYNTNYGTYLPSQLALYNSTITIPNCKRNDYDLVSVSDGNKTYQVGDIVPVTDNMTFTYTWKPATEYLTVTIITQNGSVKVTMNNQTIKGTESGSIFTYSIPKNSKITLTAFPNDGYNFTNFNGVTTSNPYALTITANTTIKTNYTAQTDEIDVYYIDADYVQPTSADYQEYVDKIEIAIKSLPEIVEPITGKVTVSNGIIDFNGKVNKFISKSIYLLMPRNYNIDAMKYYDTIKETWIGMDKEIFVQNAATAVGIDYWVWLVHKLDNSGVGGTAPVQMSIIEA